MAGKDIHEEFGFRKFPEQVKFRSEKVVTSGKVTEMEVQAIIPDETSAEAVVTQEWGESVDDSNNVQTITLEDGKKTYDITNLEYGGQHVWVEFDLRSESGKRLPGILSYSLRE